MTAHASPTPPPPAPPPPPLPPPPASHPPLPPPPLLQPAPKVSSTAKSTHLSAVANSSPATSRSSSQVRPSRAKQNANSPEYTSQKATAALIRRVLGPQTAVDPRNSPRPVDDILPPLTSSNEVDLQLYAIIAIVIKDFVQVWYSKITPDHAFIQEVIHVIAHCSRAVEQRLRRIDVDELILDEIPALIEAHISAYRTARQTSPSSAYHSAPPRSYHSLNPHPALSPFPDAKLPEPCRMQAQNETMYRQLLVQGAVALLLPTEDLQNASLRTLVSDVVADLILGQGIGGKACQGWFLHETITKVVELIKSRVKPQAKGEEIEHDTRSRLEKFSLLSAKAEPSPPHSSAYRQSRVSEMFWTVLQYAYLSSLFVRFLVVGVFRARTMPSRSHSSRSTSSSPIANRGAPSPSTPSQSWSILPPSPPRPILEYRLLALVSTLLDLSARMSWLTGMLSLCRHGVVTGFGRLGAADSLLDKFLHHTLTTHITPWPALLPTILLNLRVALFPLNSKGPPAPPPPGREEQLQIRRRAAEAILSLVPKPVARVYFAVPSSPGNTDVEDTAREQSDTEEGEFEQMVDEVEELLDLVGDSYVNKHLVYNILELVIVRLVPEMGVRGVEELLAERGVVIGGKAYDGDGDEVVKEKLDKGFD